MTPAEMFASAYGRNRKNQPGKITTAPEILAIFNRVFPTFWTIGARVNPSFFGKILAVSHGAESGISAWCRPDDAELVYLIDNPEGEQVIVVPLEEPDADPSRPAVYEWGQCYYPAGNALDPAAEDDLTFWYSKIPDFVTDETAELERQWPSQFDELVILEIALVLALKDERYDEVGTLRDDRDAWLRRYIAHLEHATVGTVRSQGAAQRFQGPTVVPLNELLTAGTAVQLSP